MRTALAKHYGRQQQPRADFSNVQAGSSTAANAGNVRSRSGSTQAPPLPCASYAGPPLAPSAAAADTSPAPNPAPTHSPHRLGPGTPQPKHSPPPLQHSTK